MNTHFTPQQALPKIMQFCAYQERCHQEVKEKLFGFGLTVPEVDALLSRLIEEGFLNEQRFAIQFAGGRFRMKQWGRSKIKYTLRQKGVSDYCIKTALLQIDESEYQKTLQDLGNKKWEALNKEKNSFVKRKKLRDYLQAKGYETDLIYDFIKTV